jgi:hypothetical protein
MNDTIHLNSQEVLEIGKLINLIELNGRSVGPVLEGVLDKIDAWLEEQDNK